SSASSDRAPGRAGGQRGRCDRLLADEEPQRLTDRFTSLIEPLIKPGPIVRRMPVLLPVERLLATPSLLHHAGDAAAIAAREIEQLVPECAGAEAGHDGEIETNIDDGAAERTATHLGLQLLQGEGIEIGRMVAAEQAAHRRQHGEMWRI